MTHLQRNIFVTLFTFATIALASETTQAGGGCGSRGRCSSGISYGYRHTSVPRHYGHIQPVTRHVTSTPIVHHQHIQPSQQLRPVQPVNVQPIQPAIPNTPVFQQPNSGSVALRPIQTPPVPQPLNSGGLQQNLGGQPVSPSQPPTGVSQPLRPVSAPQSVGNTPVSSPPPASNPQLSALQALGAFMNTSPVDPQPVQEAGHVGQWQASLENGAVVKLTLNSNGQFTWVAAKDGKQNGFSGSYTVTDGNLNLTRSTDNIRLAGKMQLINNQMTFQASGAKTALNFQRG